ncbi:U2 snRNA/tRNA pseudouridine synthase, putative [Plasmodium gallinaceum]|uniref:U2 snRNA/tRNA pseudouridine synthase, putative n=1 Tax=Plasmodium gallinaceum TaxID=5849 RepID=A0A1J1H211_PLAGA|nr:U2 snRNA/tRNA pseudouridine synthase, putative [Plasmodium gallinaceum]CRG97366.1 U2 snRNA/tRNA pseudouridine synthase, putative [Plasmodium gallinaceum]
MYSINNYGIDYLIRKNINQIEGINGKIKTLYEDFHVHEITKNNEILYLNDLIDKNRINEIIEENEKNEERNILQNISNTDLNLHLISKYVNEFNKNIFRQFLHILYEMYQLKNKNEITDISFNSKDITIPYCCLTNVDSIIKDGNYDENEFCDELIQKKKLRKNIHRVIRQFYPFLITETKNVSKIETFISHGNILNDSFIKNNYNLNFDLDNNNFDNITNVIEIYPSLKCLKMILPDSIFKKLEKNSKKFRFYRNDELENIINNKFSDTKKCKNYSKTSKQNSEFLNYGNNNEKENEIDKKTNKIESNTVLKKKRKLITNNSNDEKLLNLKNYDSSNKISIMKLNQNEVYQQKESSLYDKNKNFNTNDSEIFIKDEVNNEMNSLDDKLNDHINDKKRNFQEKNTCLFSEDISSELINIKTTEDNRYLEDLNEIKQKKKELKNERKYLHFNLYKENKDICEILNKIKISLKKKNSDISYCGIKDKRGITVQKFCISKIKKEDIYKLIINKTKWCNNVYVSNLEYKKEKLSLGDLKGNFFKVLIRGVDNDIQDKCTILFNNLKKYGFINYYGSQRFGSKKIKNYDIGICILKKNYKQALFFIIENSELDNESKIILITYLNTISEDNKIKKEEEVNHNEKDYDNEKNEVVYENIKRYSKNIEMFDENEKKNFNNNKNKNCKNKMFKHENSIPEEVKRIINSISNKSYVEKMILNSLKNSTNLKNAFMNIPKDIFSLFIHATQSLIFNILTNIRMKKYGFRITIGDLVEEKGESENLSGNDSNLDNYSKNKDTCKKVTVITKDNISLYDIYDVVLPLPGDQNITFPLNLIDEYNEVLQHFNLSLNDFKSEKNFFNAAGCFRKIVVKPYNVKLVYIPNSVDNLEQIPFIKSDLYKLFNEKKKENTLRLQKEEEDYVNEKYNKNINNNYIKKSNEHAIDENNTLSIVKEEKEQKEIEENIFFISNKLYHEHLIKEIPDYQIKSSIFFTCSLPKSSYITVALKEILNI